MKDQALAFCIISKQIYLKTFYNTNFLEKEQKKKNKRCLKNIKNKRKNQYHKNSIKNFQKKNRKKMGNKIVKKIKKTKIIRIKKIMKNK